MHRCQHLFIIPESGKEFACSTWKNCTRKPVFFLPCRSLISFWYFSSNNSFRLKTCSSLKDQTPELIKDVGICASAFKVCSIFTIIFSTVGLTLVSKFKQLFKNNQALMLLLTDVIYTNVTEKHWPCKIMVRFLAWETSRSVGNIQFRLNLICNQRRCFNFWKYSNMMQFLSVWLFFRTKFNVADFCEWM